MRIGLLGGSFNPPHSGHVNLSLQIKKKYNLHKIIWLVTPHNPLKDPSIYKPFSERYHLCQKIIGLYRFIEVSDIDQKLDNYKTIKTIRYFKQKHKNDQLFWIMGADSLIDFHKWDFFREIFSEINIIIGDRDRYIHKAVRSKTAINFANTKCLNHEISKEENHLWFFESIKKDNNSSTEIRKCQK
jgi:nicotinate-nucleotide adenylyltransferase